MARTYTPGSGHNPRVSIRDSLFGAINAESATLRAEEEDDLYAERQREITDKLLPIDEEEVPITVNLLEYIDPTAVRNGQLELADDAGNPIRIDASELKDLSAFKLRDATKLTPEGVHDILRNLYYDHKLALNQTTTLREANDLNLEKYQDMSAQATRLETQIAALEQEQADWQKEKETMREELDQAMNDEGRAVLSRLEEESKQLAERVDFYKQLAADYEGQVQQLELRDQAETQDTTEALTLLRADLAEVTKENAELKARLADTANNAARNRALSPFSRQRLGLTGSGNGAQESSVRAGSTGVGANRDHTPGADSVASQFTQYDNGMLLGMKSSRDVPTPAKFANDGNPAFDEWLRDVENKIGSTTFRDVPSALAYVHSLTKGNVWQLLDPRIPSRINKNSTINAFKTLEELLEYLCERFGQRDQANKSFHELATLKQGNESFSDHYTKFQKYRARVNLTDDSEKQLLEASLNYRYANRLVDGVPCKTLNELVSKCYNLEDGFARLDASKPPRDREREGNDKGRGRGRGGGTRGGRATDNNASALLPYSELPEKYKGLKPLTDDERQKLIRSGHCLRCREPGHHSRDASCVLKKYQYAPRANAMTTESTATTESGNGAAST